MFLNSSNSLAKYSLIFLIASFLQAPPSASNNAALGPSFILKINLEVGCSTSGNKKENNTSSDENLNDALMEEMGGDNDDIPF